MFQWELKKRYKYHFINFEVNTHCSYHHRPPTPDSPLLLFLNGEIENSVNWENWVERGTN